MLLCAIVDQLLRFSLEIGREKHIQRFLFLYARCGGFCSICENSNHFTSKKGQDKHHLILNDIMFLLICTTMLFHNLTKFNLFLQHHICFTHYLLPAIVELWVLQQLSKCLQDCIFILYDLTWRCKNMYSTSANLRHRQKINCLGWIKMARYHLQA